MGNIIIGSFDQKLGNKVHPKHYPYWEDVVNKLQDHHLIQLGAGADKHYCQDFRFLNLMGIEKLLRECKCFITVDSFLHHLAHRIGGVKGVVIWGPSDPSIFGYEEHVNLLKDRKYLRKRQFGLWSEVEHDPSVFMDPELVIKVIKGLFRDG